MSNLRSPAIGTTQHTKRGSQVLEWEETSYTKIPRGWARFWREAANFLRFVGLGIVFVTIRGTFQSDFSEPKKVTVYRSRVSALLRALIHVFPMGFALLEITVNLRGHYVGGTFTKQSYYQLAAKAHELAVDASLASIILSYIRHELTTGDGLPFGAFLASLQSSSVSYLWSRELYSSLFATGGKIRRIIFFLLVMICGIITATVGPSSATLLIPRQLLWSVSPSYVLENGTFQDVWPDRTNAALQGSSNCSFESMLGQLVSSDIYVGDAALGGLDGWLWSLQSPGGDYIDGGLGSCPSNRSSSQICGVSETLIIANAAFSEDDTTPWTSEKGYTSYTDLVHSVKKDFYAANTAVQCSLDTITNPNDMDVVHFPAILRTEQEYAHSTETIALENLTKAEVYAMPDNSSEYTLMWTNLPGDLFGYTVSGAVLIEPRGLMPGSPQNISLCILAAGWGTSNMVENLYAGTFFTSPYNVPAPIQKLLGRDRDNDVAAAFTTGLNFYAPIFANISGSTYPQRPVAMATEWLEYLNPVATFADGVNRTIINAYMSTFPERLSAIGLAQVITQMLTAGLSVIGTDLAWQVLPDRPVQCDSCQVFEVNHDYAGWAYDSSGIPVKLAIGVMIAYCVLALSHILYIVGCGISSDSWNSAAEVVALAMNSPPTQHLRNTCSGIYGMKPFRTIVRIVATTSDSSTNGEKDHLELVFGDGSEAKEPQVKMRFNEEYGSFPRKVHYD